jgi:hypothetical protein
VKRLAAFGARGAATTIHNLNKQQAPTPSRADARIQERTVNERPNIHDMPFSERFKGDDWSAMSDRETCPISMIDAQLIAEGKDPFMTLEEEAKEATEKALQAATKEAVELVTKAEKAETKSWELRKAAGLKLVELRQKVRGARLSFDAWFKANIPGISRATAYRYMAMVDEPELDPTEPWGMRHDNRYGVSGETGNAGHNGPEVEDKLQAKPRSANAERQARHRARKAEAKRTADKYVEDPAPASEPDRTPTVQEDPQAGDRMARWVALGNSVTPEHLETLITILTETKPLTCDAWLSEVDTFYRKRMEKDMEKREKAWKENAEFERQEFMRSFHPEQSKGAPATPFTKDELRQLSMAFHPDANLTTEKRTELFKLWNSKVG